MEKQRRTSLSRIDEEKGLLNVNVNLERIQNVRSVNCGRSCDQLWWIWWTDGARRVQGCFSEVDVMSQWTSWLHTEELDRWVEWRTKLISLYISLLWCMLGNRMRWRCLTSVDVSPLSGIGLLPLPCCHIKADAEPLTQISSHQRAGNYLHVMFPRLAV